MSDPPTPFCLTTDIDIQEATDVSRSRRKQTSAIFEGEDLLKKMNVSCFVKTEEAKAKFLNSFREDYQTAQILSICSCEYEKLVHDNMVWLETGISPENVDNPKKLKKDGHWSSEFDFSSPSIGTHEAMNGCSSLPFFSSGDRSRSSTQKIERNIDFHHIFSASRTNTKNETIDDEQGENLLDGLASLVHPSPQKSILTALDFSASEIDEISGSPSC
jgi:hypothetical protein